MTSSDAQAFAERWTSHWNERDVEAVLAHFADGVVFSSPTALAVTGNGLVEGKDALRAYWGRALQTHQSLRFVVRRTLWDAGTSELAIIYDREVNGRRDRAVEVLTFGASGLAVRGEAFYGVTPDK